MRWDRASFTGLGAWAFFLFFIFVVALQKCQIVFKNALMRNWDSIFFHAFLYFLHMVFDWVFGLQIVFKLLEDFKNKLLLFFQGFFRTQLFVLIFRLYFLDKVLVNVLTDKILLTCVIIQVRELFTKFFKRSLFCHFELFLFEMLFDGIFENFVVCADFIHEVLENLMSGAALLLGIHHVEQVFILFILGHKLSPFGLVSDFSAQKFIFE